MNYKTPHRKQRSDNTNPTKNIHYVLETDQRINL